MIAVVIGCIALLGLLHCELTPSGAPRDCNGTPNWFLNLP